MVRPCRHVGARSAADGADTPPDTPQGPCHRRALRPSGQRGPFHYPVALSRFQGLPLSADPSSTRGCPGRGRESPDTRFLRCRPMWRYGHHIGSADRHRSHLQPSSASRNIGCFSGLPNWRRSSVRRVVRTDLIPGSDSGQLDRQEQLKDACDHGEGMPHLVVAEDRRHRVGRLAGEANCSSRVGRHGGRK